MPAQIWVDQAGRGGALAGRGLGDLADAGGRLLGHDLLGDGLGHVEQVEHELVLDVEDLAGEGELVVDELLDGREVLAEALGRQGRDRGLDVVDGLADVLDDRAMHGDERLEGLLLGVGDRVHDVGGGSGHVGGFLSECPPRGGGGSGGVLLTMPSAA